MFLGYYLKCSYNKPLTLLWQEDLVEALPEPSLPGGMHWHQYVRINLFNSLLQLIPGDVAGGMEGIALARGVQPAFPLIVAVNGQWNRAVQLPRGWPKSA